MDEALARAGARAADGDELVAAALDVEHWMRDEPHREPPVRKLAHDRVEQERHVVIDDLDHADRAKAGRLLQVDGGAAEPRRARFAVLQQTIGPRRKQREVASGVAQQVFRHGAAVELDGKCRRHLRVGRFQRLGGLFEERPGGAVVVARGGVGSHGRPRAGAENRSRRVGSVHNLRAVVESKARDLDPLMTNPTASSPCSQTVDRPSLFAAGRTIYEG